MINFVSNDDTEQDVLFTGYQIDMWYWQSSSLWAEGSYEWKQCLIQIITIILIHCTLVFDCDFDTNNYTWIIEPIILHTF